MRIAGDVAKQEGVELYWVKYQNSPGYQRLQVLIDKEGGVSLDDCERVSRSLGDRFDEQIHHRYELEVSSPGLDRPLYMEAHYRRAVGQRIQVKCVAPVHGQKIWHGILCAARDAGVTLKTSQGIIEIALDQVAHAQVTPDFDLS